MEGDSKCLFCDENCSKYSCPRCLARYCSLKCYRHEKHLECSETFYKQEVMSALKEMKGTDEDKEKIMNILKKMKKQNDDETKHNDETDSISQRLGDVDLDDGDAVWELLTPQERALFQTYVSKGNLNFVPTWKPWWCDQNTSKVVELPLRKDTGQLPLRKDTGKSLPKILKNLPQLKDLLNDKTPDPNLKFCILDVLLAYLCTQRVFNGDMYDAPVESINVISQLSKVLSENAIYSDIETCLHNFVSNVASTPHIHVDAITVSLQDLHDVITSSNGNLVQRALSDLHRYLQRCRKHLKDETTTMELSQSCFKMAKKVYFYVVYCREFPRDVTLLAQSVSKVQDELLMEQDMWNGQKDDIEKHLQKLKPKGSNVLIEEIL